MFIYIWTSLPRKGADPIDAGHIDDISLGFLEVGHGQHCQVQHCPDVGGHHPEGGDVNVMVLHIEEIECLFATVHCSKTTAMNWYHGRLLGNLLNPLFGRKS